MISSRPAKHVIIGKVVLDLGIVPRTRADLEPRTDKSEFVNGIGDGAGGAVYPQLVCGDDGYVDEGIVDADIAEGEDVDLVIGEQVSPASAQETSVDRDIQREIQVRLARRCAVGGQETACPERLKRIRVAEEEAHPKVVLVVMKCAIPISRKLVVGKAAGIAAGERSGLSEGDSSGTVGIRDPLAPLQNWLLPCNCSNLSTTGSICALSTLGRKVCTSEAFDRSVGRFGMVVLISVPKSAPLR